VVCAHIARSYPVCRYHINQRSSQWCQRSHSGVSACRAFQMNIIPTDRVTCNARKYKSVGKEPWDFLGFSSLHHIAVISRLYFNMHIHTLLIALFSTVTVAQINSCTGNKNTTGYCETRSYIDRTASSSHPPFAADCQDSCRGILGEAGDWTVRFPGILALSQRHSL
jgi:hypothetical protein